ncbi:MAG TPA: hypothetical protein VH115_06705 [Solirubrobacteraceae bacterium]|nr:hypothetical protein [Solirubrobacteraceae bacterium]
MSREDVEVVRQLLVPFEQGEIVPLFRDDAVSAALTAASAPFFTSDFECVFVRDDVGRAAYLRLDGLRTAWLDWLLPWESYHAEIEDVIDAGEGRVLVLTRDYARPQISSPPGTGESRTGSRSAMPWRRTNPLWLHKRSAIARVRFWYVDARRAVPGSLCGRSPLGLGSPSGLLRLEDA